MRPSISTVIAKPTKACNADCTYCAAPPDGAPKWSLDDWKRHFDRLAPYLTEQAVILWHGGEPTLLSPEFYVAAWEYSRSIKPEIRFSMQTNLLSYSRDRWYDVFSNIMKGSISTSYDPDERNREYKGSTLLYSKLFFRRLEAALADGFRPKVIGTYTEETAHLAMSVYERSLAYDRAQEGGGFHIRFNYRYPAGRAEGEGAAITPETYGRMLLALYDRWIRELPSFVITPLDEMMKKVLNVEVHRCPWTRGCGGRFLGLEPNGDAYNCSEFADLGDEEYLFGNLNEMTIPDMFAGRAARAIRRRQVDLPMDCTTCRHFAECEGGCMRDAALYGRGLGGKFYYCASWMMVLDRIKASCLSGEADGAIAMFGEDPGTVRCRVAAMAPRALAA